MVRSKSSNFTTGVLVGLDDRFVLATTNPFHRNLTPPHCEVNMFVHAVRCQLSTSNVDYEGICRITSIFAPALSIMTNISVMTLVLLKAWYGPHFSPVGTLMNYCLGCFVMFYSMYGGREKQISCSRCLCYSWSPVRCMLSYW